MSCLVWMSLILYLIVLSISFWFEYNGYLFIMAESIAEVVWANSMFEKHTCNARAWTMQRCAVNFMSICPWDYSMWPWNPVGSQFCDNHCSGMHGKMLCICSSTGTCHSRSSWRSSNAWSCAVLLFLVRPVDAWYATTAEMWSITHFSSWQHNWSTWPEVRRTTCIILVCSKYEKILIALFAHNMTWLSELKISLPIRGDPLLSLEWGMPRESWQRPPFVNWWPYW